MDIMKAFARSKQGKKIVAEEERVEVAAREGMLEEIESLRAEIKAGLPALKEELTDAEAAATEAYAAHLSGNFRLQQAKAASYGFSSSLDGRIASLEAQLREGSDGGRIGDVLSQLRSLWDDERHGWHAAHPGDPDSSHRRIAEIGTAVERAESLKLVANPDVGEELSEIRAQFGIPEPKGAPA